MSFSRRARHVTLALLSYKSSLACTRRCLSPTTRTASAPCSRWTNGFCLNDDTRGFVGFRPMPYQPENNEIPVENPPSDFDALRTIAVSRIYLDNFDHITAYWVGMGLKLAQVALSYGADDLHGTIIEEHIFHMAGAKSPQLQTEAEMVKAIRETGRTPVQRGTFYEPIKVWDGAPTAAETEPPSGKSKVLEDNLATA